MKYKDFRLSQAQMNDVIDYVVNTKSAKYIKENGFEPSQDIINSFTNVEPEEIERWRRIYYVAQYISGSGDDDPITGDTEDVADGIVKFIDYDGTPVRIYSSQEFYNLRVMPENPVHEGLMPQGWNWEFETAREYVKKYGNLIVGQMYTTDDSKNRFYITVTSPSTVTASWAQNYPHGVLVDWGDGDVSTINATGTTGVAHTYSAAGDYTISFMKINGNVAWRFENKPVYFENKPGSSTEYLGYLRKVELCGDIVLGENAFNTYPNMVSVAVPHGITFAGEGIFSNCQNLKAFVVPDNMVQIPGDSFIHDRGLKIVSFPNGLSSIGGSSFANCEELSEFTIPDAVGNIGSYTFLNCKALSAVTLPEEIARLNNSLFNGCLGLSELRVFNPVPPTMGNEVFNGVRNDLQVYVPAESVDTYKTASGWDRYADNTFAI